MSLRYNALEEGDFNLKIVDIAGQTKFQQTKHFAKGENIVELKTSEMAVGVYFVKVSNEQQTMVAKFLIER